MKSLKRLIEMQEKQNEDLAKLFHSEILPDIVVVKMNIHTMLKKVLKDKLNPEVFESEMEGLNRLSLVLREVMANLYPPMLKYYGPIKSFKNFVYSYSLQNNMLIRVNCDESIENTTYPNKIHIFNLFKTLLVYFSEVGDKKPINVTILRVEDKLIVEFKREENVNVTTFHKKVYESSSETIEARMLMLDASTGKSGDWYNFIQIIIPLNNRFMIQKIKIGLAEDHVFVRQGLISILENNENLKVVFDVNNGLELMESLKSNIPDIILLDIEMPEMNGIEALKQISTLYPEIKIIMLTMFLKREYVVECVHYGARAFLHKTASFSKIFEAINSVHNTGHYFDENIAEILALEPACNNSNITEKSKNKLTKREIEIFNLVIEGKSNNEIAEILFLSVRTVEWHRLKLSKKCPSSLKITTSRSKNQ